MHGLISSLEKTMSPATSVWFRQLHYGLENGSQRCPLNYIYGKYALRGCCKPFTCYRMDLLQIQNKFVHCHHGAIPKEEIYSGSFCLQLYTYLTDYEFANTSGRSMCLIYLRFGVLFFCLLVLLADECNWVHPNLAKIMLSVG